MKIYVLQENDYETVPYSYHATLEGAQNAEVDLGTPFRKYPIKLRDYGEWVKTDDYSWEIRTDHFGIWGITEWDVKI
jgi:hypothetical protein